jgi:ATP-binding protein involved in chromosome partitioning
VELTVDLIRERLSEIRPAGLRRDVIAAGLVRDVRLDGDRVSIDLLRGPLPQPILDATLEEIRRSIGAFDGIDRVDVQVVEPTGAGAEEIGPIPGVAHIVAVASTKGGVGKSTVCVNLACALAQRGLRVGLLDADVYGPSMPTMLGSFGRPEVLEGNKVKPVEAHGIRFISMGLLVDDSAPVIWRGPLVTGVLRQFLKDVQWGELDVLMIDLPPGTGDAQLTLVQQVPVTGAVVVTTPQEVSLIDVERGVAMFRQVNTPVIGIVENMSEFVCAACGHRDPLFGSGGGSALAQRFEVPLLAKIPITEAIRSAGDAGAPIVVSQGAHPVSAIYAHLAAQVAEALESGAGRTPSPRIIG